MKLPSILPLIQNENMKIYRRIGTWFMIALLALSTLAGALITKATHKEPKNWKAEVASEIKEMEAQLSEEKVPKMYKNHLEQQLKINEYRLEHNIKPVASNTFWGYLVNSADIIALITLFTIIVAAGSVANEFSWGTIKLLLIRPASRTKILLSKYIAALLFALCMLLLLFVFSSVVGAIVFGIENIREPYLAYQNGTVVEKSMLLHVMQVYALNCVDLVMMTTFAFMISAVFRNHSLAVGLATFALFAGPQITTLLAMKFDWAKYLLFANTDLTQYIDGTPLVEGMTMPFSMMMLLIYFVIFNALTWFIFRKRDIAA